jgi:hypothetical protein
VVPIIISAEPAGGLVARYREDVDCRREERKKKGQAGERDLTGLPFLPLSL